MSDVEPNTPSAETVDEEYVFDPDRTDLTLSDVQGVSKFDIKDMAKMNLLSVETEERDGETVVTECSFNMTALASVVGELDVVERKMGDDWRDTSWNPKVRLKYLDA